MSRELPDLLAIRWTRRGIVASTAAGAFSSLAGSRTSRSAAVPRPQVKSLRFALSSSDRVRVLPLLADYQRETGVEVVPVTFGDLYRALSVELMGDECSFDVVSIDDPWIAVFAGGRFLKNLDQLGDTIQQPLDLADFLPTFLSLGLAPESAELYAVPWIGNVQVFGYDAPVFRAEGVTPPRTWPDAIAAAQAITRARAPDTFGFGLRGRPGTSATTTFLPILRGYGVQLFDADWWPQLETDAASRAMETLLDLATFSPPDVIDTGHQELAAQVERGEIAQSADLWPTQLFGWSESGLGNPLSAIQIAATPREPGVESSPITGNWLLGIPAACDLTAPAALEFIRWLTSPHQQLRLLLESGLPPTRIGVMENKTAISQLPLLPRIAELSKLATSRPRTHFFPAVDQILGYWVAAALARDISGDQALSQANSEIQAVMRPGNTRPSTAF